MKRSDFMYWGVGLLFIYLGITGSFNPTSSHGIYVAYTWQATVGLLLLTLTGCVLLGVPAYIDLIREEARLEQ